MVEKRKKKEGTPQKRIKSSVSTNDHARASGNPILIIITKVVLFRGRQGLVMNDPKGAAATRHCWAVCVPLLPPPSQTCVARINRLRRRRKKRKKRGPSFSHFSISQEFNGGGKSRAFFASAMESDRVALIVAVENRREEREEEKKIDADSFYWPDKDMGEILSAPGRRINRWLHPSA